ncbi:MAG TPA: PAC2 family protein [Planctomycetota bacterium]|nr:PAC2 family protein [Planctomycetota bacterium]
MAANKLATGSRLLAVWPGMGHVALTAGLYLMSKLQMREEEPLATGDLFDLDHIDVTKGLATPGHIPMSHLYAFRDPRKNGDLGLVIGEAQPPTHKLEYCRRILDGAERLGVGQVVTFAAIAFDIHPRDPSRVFGVATHPEWLEALRSHGIEVFESGQIQGMNGVFLAAAAERGIPGVCLMGSMPALAAQIPYPKAAHAVLQAFASLCDIPLDLEELKEYGRGIDQKLTMGLEKLKEVLSTPADPEAGVQSPPSEEDPADGVVEEGVEGPPAKVRERIEELFEQAKQDRSKAFELKRELDNLGAFKDYENRFLDLFRRRP